MKKFLAILILGAYAGVFASASVPEEDGKTVVHSAAVDALTVQLGALTTAIDAEKEQNAQLQAALAVLSAERDALRSTVVSMRDAVDEDLTAQLGALTTEVVDEKAKNAELQAALAVISAQRDALNASLASVMAQLQPLTEKLQEAATIISDLDPGQQNAGATEFVESLGAMFG